MEALKAVGSVMLFVIVVCGLMLAGALFIGGTVRITQIVLPYLATATTYVFLICGLIFFPLTAFNRTKFVAIIAIYASSYVFGVMNWAIGLLVTYQLWGIFGVILGLFIAGVGVVPVGIVASAFDGDWPMVWNLVFGAVITFGARFFALHRAAQLDSEPNVA